MVGEWSLQYMQKHMGTVRALLYLVVGWYRPIYHYPAGSSHRHWGSYTISPEQSSKKIWVIGHINPPRTDNVHCAYCAKYTVSQHNVSVSESIDGHMVFMVFQLIFCRSQLTCVNHIPVVYVTLYFVHNECRKCTKWWHTINRFLYIIACSCSYSCFRFGLVWSFQRRQVGRYVAEMAPVLNQIDMNSMITYI